MTGLSSLLRLGSGAASAQQRRMSTVHQNVANASTPGYRRQRADLQTLGGAVGGQQLGVTTGQRRSIDAPLTDRLVPGYRGEVGGHRAKLEVALFTEGLLANEGSDVSARLGDFFSSARALEADPSNSIGRRDFVERAQSLADGIRRNHDALSDVREQNRAQITDTVAHLNTTLGQIAALDQQLQQGASSPELIDARDALVAEVSDKIGARAVPGKQGTINLVSEDGAALVEAGRARSLTASVDAGGKLEIKLGSGRALQAVGGALGGMIAADEEVVGAALGELEEFAQSFATEVNRVHAQGFGKDGASGRDLFEFQAGSAARSLQVDAALRDDPELVAAAGVAGNVPGGNGNIQALMELEQAAIIGNKTPHGALLAGQTRLGQTIQRAQGELMASQGALEHIEDVQASISGVSLEEELVAMTEAKHAFEAATKLMSVADEMLGTVLSLR